MPYTYSGQDRVNPLLLLGRGVLAQLLQQLEQVLVVLSRAWEVISVDEDMDVLTHVLSLSLRLAT